jgi:hypothetical protein
MSNDVWRWVITLALFAHGVGHILFMPVIAPALKLAVSGHSWLLTGVLGEGPTKVLASAAGLALLGAFVAASGGVLMHAPWWRPVAIGAAVGSLALIIAVWDGLPASSAFWALAFDVVVLIALVFAHWPTEEMVGA